MQQRKNVIILFKLISIGLTVSFGKGQVGGWRRHKNEMPLL
jgi:hypothetical protein